MKTKFQVWKTIEINGEEFDLVAENCCNNFGFNKNGYTDSGETTHKDVILRIAEEFGLELVTDQMIEEISKLKPEAYRKCNPYHIVPTATGRILGFNKIRESEFEFLDFDEVQPDWDTFNIEIKWIFIQPRENG